MTSRFGEAEIIRQVAQRFAGLSHGVQVGIGDDAAVLDIEEPISQLLTTDTLIEGVHSLPPGHALRLPLDSKDQVEAVTEPYWTLPLHIDGNGHGNARGNGGKNGHASASEAPIGFQNSAWG